MPPVQESAQDDAPVPALVVFDCDMCLWSPEMFELSGGPSSWDKAKNAVKAGRDWVTLFAGASTALRELSTQERFSRTKIAVASSTSKREWAFRCLRLLEATPGVKVDELLSYREIYPDNKSRHFKQLHVESSIPYDEMLFFDDCNWGDNCRDVEWACPGVVTVKTPEGLTEKEWAEGLAKYAESKR